ncbi:MAG TPA: M23 family metallopeptidase [Spirochaetota bacterium]|nr:M23 family metallopeptidase [Spirochaetota bacterium]
MKRKAVIIIVAISCVISTLYATETGSIKTTKIIEYKNFSGQWVDNSNPEILQEAIITYSAGEKNIIRANGPEYKKLKKIFIPFSDSYLAYVKSRASCVNETARVNKFRWPIDNFDRISSSFGRRWGSFHEGIDIPAGRGIPILAACGGRVIYTGYAGNLGHTVTLEHRGNMYTRYCHASKILVKEGDLVKKGQIIANVGSSGNSTGHHLHFEIRYGDFPLNPLDFLPFSPSVKKTQYLKKID